MAYILFTFSIYSDIDVAFSLGCLCSVLSNYNDIICFPYVMT